MVKYLGNSKAVLRCITIYNVPIKDNESRQTQHLGSICFQRKNGSLISKNRNYITQPNKRFSFNKKNMAYVQRKVSKGVCSVHTVQLCIVSNTIILFIHKVKIRFLPWHKAASRTLMRYEFNIQDDHYFAAKRTSTVNLAYSGTRLQVWTDTDNVKYRSHYWWVDQFALSSKQQAVTTCLCSSARDELDCELIQICNKIKIYDIIFISLLKPLFCDENSRYLIKINTFLLLRHEATNRIELLSFPLIIYEMRLFS